MADSSEFCNGEGGGPLQYRPATADDTPLLARLNRELIEDEGHRNPMTLPELEARMRRWLEGEYVAALFEREGQVVAYALYLVRASDIQVRHLYALRGARRQGIASAALRLLAREVWPPQARVSLDVLVGNIGALAFYRALGFRPCSLTLEIENRALRAQPPTHECGKEAKAD